MKEDRCKSCGAPVFWGKNAKTGKPLIIDLDPTNNGNVRLLSGNGMVEVRGVNADWDDPFEPRYTSHWATCPDAKGWRKA